MIVVDSGAVVDALTAGEGTDDLGAFLASEELNAPELLDFEVVSAPRGLTLRGDLTAARAEDVLTDFEGRLTDFRNAPRADDRDHGQ